MITLAALAFSCLTYQEFTYCLDRDSVVANKEHDRVASWSVKSINPAGPKYTLYISHRCGYPVLWATLSPRAGWIKAAAPAGSLDAKLVNMMCSVPAKG